MKDELIQKVIENYALSEKDISLVRSLTDYDMNLPRTSEIMNFILELKLDKASAIGFLGYQRLTRLEPISFLRRSLRTK